MLQNSVALLPAPFLDATEAIMGRERFERFLGAFQEEPPVSVRLNPLKTNLQSPLFNLQSPVPWCADGRYLSQRPNFTFDPLFHAGCYYVQEAASQFVTHCIRSLLKPTEAPPSAPEGATIVLREVRRGEPIEAPRGGRRGGLALDLCAAPGGKSTALRSVLPAEWLLVSNEPVRKRAQILSENMQKWGHPQCIVTNNYPRDFARSGLTGAFDVVLCDVPCSGEGMFRKDPAAIGEWSPQNVERCWQLQRQIVADIWPCLRPGGVLVYSTCTFNTKENEENVKWLLETFDADIVDIPTLPDWHIVGSLLPGFDMPVYRFIPGTTRSEGLFVAVVRKSGDDAPREGKKAKAVSTALSRLNIMEQSACAEALSADFDATRHTVVTLDYDTAIAYLRREAIVLSSDTPRGIVVVAYQGHPLGVAKNIGSRANNLYPREWAIKSTYRPGGEGGVLKE